MNGKGRRKTALRPLALIVWCLVWLGVAWAMLDPSPPKLQDVSDKSLHFASFFVMSLAAVGFCRSLRQLAAAALVCAVAGVAIEAAQLLVPSRNFQWSDIVANLSGTASGLVLAGLLLAFHQRRRRSRRSTQRRRRASATAALSRS